MNLSDYFNNSKDADDSAGGGGDLLSDAELPAGTVVVAEIVYSKAGTTKSGAPSWTNKLQVLEGDHAGGEFFDSIYLSGKQSAGALGYNKRQFAKLGAAGLDADFFSSNPSTDATATALKGTKVAVTIKWQEITDEERAAGKTPFGEHTWSSAAAAAEGAAEGITPSGF